MYIFILIRFHTSVSRGLPLVKRTGQLLATHKECYPYRIKIIYGKTVKHQMHLY